LLLVLRGRDWRWETRVECLERDYLCPSGVMEATASMRQTGQPRRAHGDAASTRTKQWQFHSCQGKAKEDFGLGNHRAGPLPLSHGQGCAGRDSALGSSRQLSRSAAALFSASPRSQRRRPATDVPTLTHHPAPRPPTPRRRTKTKKTRRFFPHMPPLSLNAR